MLCVCVCVVVGRENGEGWGSLCNTRTPILSLHALACPSHHTSIIPSGVTKPRPQVTHHSFTRVVGVDAPELESHPVSEQYQDVSGCSLLQRLKPYTDKY